MLPFLKNSADEDEGSGEAPAFMVYYCSVMILLLAFFIVLQAFADEQHDELFFQGQGSFIRALQNLGLGVLSPDRSTRPSREPAPRYRDRDGADQEPIHRSFDPDTEAARRALMELSRDLDVQRLDNATGYRVEIATPIEYAPDKTELTERERRFVQRLAPRIEGAIMARRFVVRISSSMSRDIHEVSLEDAMAALSVATLIRDELIAAMSPQAREVATARMYSFLRSDDDDRIGEGRTLRIDIMMTKPYGSVRERGE